ncbi:MAG: alkaline phosphatase family protein [Bdellovibrionota bacterium]
MKKNRSTFNKFLFCVFVALTPKAAWAYVGPGAGFAFLGSAFVFILAFGMAFLTLAFWPLQWVWRKLRGKKISKKARTRRVVIVGLDGLEPSLVERYMQEGMLPNFSALKQEGGYSKLGSTLPPVSPVAWSTYQTGVNPGAHNIFDFLTRDKRFCMPNLSSTKTEPPKKFLHLGKFIYPLGKAKISILRKSQPFWKVLGKYGVFSTVLRVPISYPPEKFAGNILSAMCVPDLLGTQGSFTFFTTEDLTKNENHTGGRFCQLTRKGESFYGIIEGPLHPYHKDPTPLKVKFKFTPNGAGGVLEIGKDKISLKEGEYSPWINLKFKFGLRGEVCGISRFCLRSLEPEVTIYMTAMNINPEKPSLPISYPPFFSTYLAKKQGLYGTLGLMEDTWGRNEKAIDDERFLEQTYIFHEEREKMFFDALDRTKEGFCTCVFDASDRIQHMFWRYVDDKHPSPREDNKAFESAIPDMYQKMDDLLGRVRAKIKPQDVLIVLSDHGFGSFRRCVNINTWLYKNGYLALKNDKISDTDYLLDVDWSKTRAFSIGLAGIFINRKGREFNGIVTDEDLPALKQEIMEKLSTLEDPETGERVVRKLYDTAKEYKGVYRNDAYDIVVGFKRGYRISWESVTGKLRPEVFENNMKAWSGDHCVDPELVPGVIFSNWKIVGQNPAIIDIAPTVLNLFAVPVPPYMEGKIIL